MDEYQHLLFFEAGELTQKEKDKVRRYFQKRRDSGGGDCGTIEKVGDNVYKICFKEQEDQERVLQRKFHTISLPSGELRLILSRTSSPQTPNQPSTQIVSKPNTKSLEKIFKIDIFLLYYLRDNPKAYKALEKQLSAIGCSVELDCDKEEAVVRGDVEKGPGRGFNAAEKWELQVDRILIDLTDTYVCHHVLDPKQMRVLQKDPSFASEDIRVYTEKGYSVVVGEVGAVNERIGNLEKSVPIRKELPVVEKKFKLIEEEFNRAIWEQYSEVKIVKGDAVIILDGPEKGVKAGAAKLDELLNKVKEKRVNLPADLITFIKSSGAISRYQTRFQQSLRNPVSLEVGSNLVLSSLSPGALDEAEAAVLRDLRVDTVQLQGAAGVSPDLDRVKEILLKAKNEANCREFRVDVSFIPGMSGTAGTRVQLVGYSENVNKLKEVLHDYQMNHVETREVMHLSPELVDCFDKVLGLIGMKQTKVTLKACQFPNPCVVVSGPRSLVREAQANLKATLSSLTSDRLVLDGSGAQRYFQAEGKLNIELLESSCEVIIREQQTVRSSNIKFEPQNTTSPICITPRSLIIKGSQNKSNLEIKLGSLEDEQVNVLVIPMLNKKLSSTTIGKCVLRKAGDILRRIFDLMAAKCNIVPGDVLQVHEPPYLGCSKLFFIECLPWDGVKGQSVQALGNGLKKCLDLCVQQGLSSVAFPVIGPGVALGYPLREAVQVLTDKICNFGSAASSDCLSTIHIVIKPDYPDSEECYQNIYRQLNLNINQTDQVIFRSLNSDLDEITLTVGGGYKLQLVFGDITNETTDVVVNTTDFTDFDTDGVCKDILTKAGPQVAAILKTTSLNQGAVVRTPPGLFPCKAILHVCVEKDADVIEQLVVRIIQDCESYQYKSVAIPAMCAGIGGLDPYVVARAILQGIKITTSRSLHFVNNIRLILNKINVFLAFKHQTTQMFPRAVINRESVSQLPHIPQQQSTMTLTDQSIIGTSSTCQQQTSVFMFVGLCKNNVEDAKTKLKDLYQAQCSAQTFTKHQLKGFTQDDMKDLKTKVEAEGLHIQWNHSGRGSLTVSGLKHGVNQVMQMIESFGPLRREMRVKEEEDLYIRVAWCILGKSGKWKRLPRTANYNLEKCDVNGGILDTQGKSWSVDLQRMEAKKDRTSIKLKRLENLPDLTLPLYWDNMGTGENMKAVELAPSTAEYQTVKEAFSQTVTKTVIKIERVQNVHLLRAYEAQKKHISDKNKLEGGADEKLLYHGMTQDNCDSIMKTGFNRRFAGQNATVFGQGTYFAVNASYSANQIYSKPAADGSQLMFVARVLTGTYTVGRSDMKVPPPRNEQQPHDRYDSVVNSTDNPSMYVVFHDNQAYPDYLITFK